MFRVGQKVVCVDDVPVPGLRWFEGKPTVGAVYTIVRVGHNSRFNCLCVWLHEIVNSGPGERDYGYGTFRFRPIVDRPTDISVFKEMLHPSKIAEACDV
jgi:hypothetical protein